jgi:hypothetical protein
MALAYEDLRIAPSRDVSLVAEAAFLDSPELSLGNSSTFGHGDEPSDITFDTPTFLSDIDRQEEEQRLLQLVLQRVGHNQISLAYATAVTAPWLVDASFVRELSVVYCHISELASICLHVLRCYRIPTFLIMGYCVSSTVARVQSGHFSHWVFSPSRRRTVSIDDLILDVVTGSA